MFLADPVGNGTAKDKRLDPTPVDELVAVSCPVLLNVCPHAQKLTYRKLYSAYFFLL